MAARHAVAEAAGGHGYVGVANQNDLGVGDVGERDGCAGPIDHVLPDRVARRGMGEGDTSDGRRRLECVEPGLLLRTEHLTCPASCATGVAAEAFDVDLVENRQIVIAGENDGGGITQAIDALVGSGAVADDIAEAPQFVVAVALGSQYRLERVQVAMDIGEDERAHSLGG
jgi:hypothetical protein